MRKGVFGFLLALAGLLVVANTASAQFRGYRSGYSMPFNYGSFGSYGWSYPQTLGRYSYPSTYSAYSYPAGYTYSYPSSGSVVYSSSGTVISAAPARMIAMHSTLSGRIRALKTRRSRISVTAG